MPCHHKFQHYLHLERIDFEPTTLVVGTFNPEWPASNTAEWFYGRTTNNYFWDTLPRLYGEASLIRADATTWKQFCRDKQIALTDLISSIDDAMPDNRNHQKMLGGFSDDAIIHNFDEFSFVDIVSLLRRHTTITQVYISRSITEPFWRHLWNPVAHYCNHHHIHEAQLLKPTGDAFYHQEAYNNTHPDNLIPRLEDYILMRWRAQWHF
jgi:hypothetical protein